MIVIAIVILGGILLYLRISTQKDFYKKINDMNYKEKILFPMYVDEYCRLKNISIINYKYIKDNEIKKMKLCIKILFYIRNEYDVAYNDGFDLSFNSEMRKVIENVWKNIAKSPKLHKYLTEEDVYDEIKYNNIMQEIQNLEEKGEYNKANIDEYISKSNKIALDKEISKEEINNISLSIKRYFYNQNHNVQSFFSLFKRLKIKQGFILTSFVRDGVIYPYIKDENKIYKEDEYEDMMYRDEEDENISFSKNMDKIVFDKRDPVACFELLVFNYYVSVFFFNSNEYGGKIIMNEVDKVNLSKRHDNNLYYSSKERETILKIDIPRRVAYNKDKSISISMITTDASYEILLSDYKITKSNEIYKVDENLLVNPKYLY